MSLAAMDLALALRAVFEEERECESPQHSTRPEDHAGTAEWYVHVKHGCGRDEVHALCDKVKRVLEDPLALAYCGRCGLDVVVSDVVQSFTRIGSGV